MKVTHIRIRKADGPLTVMDAFVDKGLTEGGHASLPDIDVDYASDRRQEIKDYLEERYNADGRQRVFSAGTFTTMKLKAALKQTVKEVMSELVSDYNRALRRMQDHLSWGE